MGRKRSEKELTYPWRVRSGYLLELLNVGLLLQWVCGRWQLSVAGIGCAGACKANSRCNGAGRAGGASYKQFCRSSGGAACRSTRASGCAELGSPRGMEMEMEMGEDEGGSRKY